MKVSVIVPIYNVESYIEECLISLINQKFDDYEIVLVNDGTKDDSIKVVKKYIEKYENIRLLNKENGGLSSARNYGLKYAKGEYICFVDSDDLVNENYLSNLYNRAKKENLDIGLGFHQKFWGDKRIEKINRKSLESKCVLTGIEVINEQLDNKDFFAEVWDDIFNRRFLEENNLRFYEGIYHEDEEFTFRAILAAKRVGYIESYDYLYRQRENSIMSPNNIDKRLIGLIKIVNSLQQLYVDNDNVKVKQLIYTRSINLMNTITAIIIEQEKYSEYIKIIEDKINLKFWKRKSSNMKERILGLLLAIDYRGYSIIYKFMN